MAESSDQHQVNDEGTVGRNDADAGQRPGSESGQFDGDQKAREQDYFASHGFQKLVTALVTIFVLVLCGFLVALMGWLIDHGSQAAHAVTAADAATPVIVALFGVLITGIFVFMTLRIESGAKKEAQAVAKAEAQIQADLAARMAASSEARQVAEAERSEARRVVEAERLEARRLAEVDKMETRNRAEEVAREIAREVAVKSVQDEFARIQALLRR